MKLSATVWQRVAILGALLVLWEIIPRLSGLSPIILPPLSTVLQSFAERVVSGALLSDLGTTMRFLLVGAGIGAGIALLLSALATLSNWGRNLLQVLVSVFNPLPAIALLPVALLWFGFSDTAVIFVVVMSVIWPMALSIHSGFATIRPVTVAVGRNLGLSGFQLIRSIYLPAALPSILSGVRLGWAFAWRTGISAELVYGAAGTAGGLGWRIYQDRAFLNTSGVFSGLLTIILVGLLVEYFIFAQISARTVERWGMQH